MKYIHLQLLAKGWVVIHVLLQNWSCYMFSLNSVEDKEELNAYKKVQAQIGKVGFHVNPLEDL